VILLGFPVNLGRPHGTGGQASTELARKSLSSQFLPQSVGTGAALPCLLSVGYLLGRRHGLGASDGRGCTPDTLFPAGDDYTLCVTACKSP
jgi:hypothetical protein